MFSVWRTARTDLVLRYDEAIAARTRTGPIQVGQPHLRRRGGLELRDVVPEVLEAVVLARLRREDVEHDVEVVVDDPARLRQAARGAWREFRVALEHGVHLVVDRLRQTRVLPGRDHEVVGV